MQSQNLPDAASGREIEGTGHSEPRETPPRAFNGREVRILDHRGLSVDTSSKSYPKSYLDGVADSVVTTVGHSEARSISDNNN